MAFPSAADFQFADDADFSFISYPQMRPIRSDYADFSTPLSPSCEEGSLSHSQALALSIRARDVAGGAIALPEFWSASGACALKGWLRVLTQQSCDCLSPSGRLYGI